MVTRLSTFSNASRPYFAPAASGWRCSSSQPRLAASRRCQTYSPLKAGIRLLCANQWRVFSQRWLGFFGHGHKWISDWAPT
jgi:hypothetical protein